MGANFTITNFISNSVDIGGGAIDGTVIGGSTAAAGTFTTGQFNTSLNVDGTVTADGLTSAVTDGSSFAANFNHTGGSVGRNGIKITSSGTSGTSTLIEALRNTTNTVFKVDGSGNLILNDQSGNQNHILNVTGAAVFNDQGADADFRVESNSNSHMLFVDGGNNRLGINTSSPSFDVDIQGANPQVNIEATTDNWSALRITSGATQANYMFFFDDTAERARISVLNNEEMNFSTASTPVERLSLSATEAVFNDTGVDTDFRVESNTNTHALFVDASDDSVGIGVGNPSDTSNHPDARLMVKGGISFNELTTASEGSLPAITQWSRDGTAQDLVIGTRSGTGGLLFYTGNTGSEGDWGETSNVERLRINSDGNVIFNDTGVDADFRVESDSNANMLFVDAGNNRVGVGNAAPSTILEVTGNGDADTGITTTHTRSGVGFTLSLNNTNNGIDKGSGIKWKSGRFNTGAIITRSDAVAASGDAPAYMTFHTSSDGTEDLTERLRLASDGAATFSSTVTHSGLTLNYNTGLYTADKSLSAYSASNGVYLNGNASGWLQLAGDGARNTRMNLFGDGNGAANQITFHTNNVHSMTLSAGAAIFNESGIDRDFRVESDTLSHALFVQGSDGYVGVGASVPQAPLQVQNALASDAATLILRNDRTRASGVKYGIEFRDNTNEANAVIQIEETGANNQARMIFKANNATGGNGITNGVEVLRLFASGAVFNENSVNSDFRVESDTNTHGLFVDAGSNIVGIGISSPTVVSGTADTSLNVGGIVSVEGILASHQTNKLILQRSGNICSVRAYGASAGDGILIFKLVVVVVAQTNKRLLFRLQQ